MRKHTRPLGLFAGMTLAVAGIILYSSSQNATDTRQGAIVSAEEQKPTATTVAYSVLDSGTNAPGAKTRKNYAVYSQKDFEDFWKIAHEGKNVIAPSIDFSKKYVVVAFQGVKETTGYSIAVAKVEDIGDTRSVSVVLNEPSKDCSVKKEKTSPYIFIEVPYGSERSHSHTDEVKEVCDK